MTIRLPAKGLPTPGTESAISVNFLYLGLPLISFAISSSMAFLRSLRFFIVATLIYFFGAKVKGFLDKHLNWLSLVFFVLVVLGFIVIRYLI